MEICWVAQVQRQGSKSVFYTFGKILETAHPHVMQTKHTTFISVSDLSYKKLKRSWAYHRSQIKKYIIKCNMLYDNGDNSIQPNGELQHFLDVTPTRPPQQNSGARYDLRILKFRPFFSPSYYTLYERVPFLSGQTFQNKNKS